MTIENVKVIRVISLMVLATSLLFAGLSAYSLILIAREGGGGLMDPSGLLIIAIPFFIITGIIAHLYTERASKKEQQLNRGIFYGLILMLISLWLVVALWFFRLIGLLVAVDMAPVIILSIGAVYPIGFLVLVFGATRNQSESQSVNKNY